jgi:hypothetical protein
MTNTTPLLIYIDMLTDNLLIYFFIFLLYRFHYQQQTDNIFSNLIVLDDNIDNL